MRTGGGAGSSALVSIALAPGLPAVARCGGTRPIVRRPPKLQEQIGSATRLVNLLPSASGFVESLNQSNIGGQTATRTSKEGDCNQVYGAITVQSN